MSSLADADLLAAACLPEYFDSRPLGVVTPIQDQGTCGACVAFAVTAAAETAILMSRRGNWKPEAEFKVDMSEQQLFFCANGEKRSCSSGWDLRPALRSLATMSSGAQRLYTGNCLKYTPYSFSKSCQATCQDAVPSGQFDWDVWDDPEYARRAIIRNGGVLTMMIWSPQIEAFFLNPSTKQGVWRKPPTGSDDKVPHAVFVVGFNTKALQPWLTPALHWMTWKRN